jgi:FtsP/CotA-like multicopper oxidase with cupredoxin domain
VPHLSRFTALALALLVGPGPARIEDPCRDPGVLSPGVDPGLHCIELVPVPDAMHVRARAILGRAASPYGVAVTVDGRQRWAITMDISGLPAPSAFGPYQVYVAWAMTPTLESVVRLGTVANGRTLVGEVALDKFLLMVSAEADSTGTERRGKPVLRGFSPSWLMHPHDESRLPPRSTPHQHQAGGWQMPPMHPAVPWMVPGLEALVPAEPPWLPGAALDPGTLEPVVAAREVHLRDGDTVRLVAGPVRRSIAGRTFVGYAYNGQVPGPLLRAPRGAAVNVEIVNRLELPTAIHWHGIRLDNPSDGVPGHTQPPIMPGERYRYQVKVPDAGVYWYHPHVREDAAQDLGLAANFLVTATGPDALPPVDREAVLMLDDMLLGPDGPIPWGRDRATHALMGRFGNVLLVNGATSWNMDARAGDVVRLFLTNAANARVFNVSVPGARLKLVGVDIGPLAREEWVDHVVLAPAERYIVDAWFPAAGEYPLLNQVRPINHPAGVFFNQVDTLGLIRVVARGGAVERRMEGSAPPRTPRDTLHVHRATADEIATAMKGLESLPEYQLVLSLRTRGLPFGLEQAIRLDTGYVNPVEWDGTMPMMDWLATGREVEWILRDAETGRENADLGWTFRRGDRVRLRIVNERRVLHPMYHSIHLHGQRFLVVAQNGVANASLGWKDTVLVPAGSTVDLLVEFSNPGMWMLHCHLAEHLEAGMHAMITVH